MSDFAFIYRPPVGRPHLFGQSRLNRWTAMRKTLAPILLTSIAFLCPPAPGVTAAEFWVSTNGSDENPGTPDQPLLSPAIALRKARELRRLQHPTVADGVHIMLRGGVYSLTTPLNVRPEDSGTEASPTVFRAAPEEAPVLSGGVLVGGWNRLPHEVPGLSSAAAGNVWVADVPRFHGRRLEFRQMWVNNQKATRARQPNKDKMERLAQWHPDKEEAWIPGALAGPYVDSAHLEMTILQQWEIANLRLKSLRVEGEQAHVTFHDPESRLEFEHPWPQPIMEPQGAPFFLTGAIEFLDQPGEGHLDRQTGRIFYWPGQDENL